MCVIRIHLLGVLPLHVAFRSFRKRRVRDQINSPRKIAIRFVGTKFIDVAPKSLLIRNIGWGEEGTRAEKIKIKVFRSSEHARASNVEKR